MADNSNQSPLFGDMMDTPKPGTPVASPVSSTPQTPLAEPAQTSDSLATILGGAGASSVPATPAIPTVETPIITPTTPVEATPVPPVTTPESSLPTSADSMAAILGSLATTPPPTIPPSEVTPSPAAVPEAPVAPPVPKPITESLSAESLTPKVAEVIQPQPESTPAVTATPVLEKTVDPRLKHYLEEDVIYNSMLRIIDAERIRLRLAIRYMILMFAIFLVIVWIVNNRIIMFGFSEFQWLARIRDSLFGVIAGLFSLTIWFGSEVWFHKWFITWFFRILSLVFFAAVLSALYFPLW